MGFFKKLLKSKAERLKEQGDYEGLLSLLRLGNIGGTESKKVCKESIVALSELGHLSSQIFDQLLILLGDDDSKVAKAANALGAKHNIGGTAKDVIVQMLAYTYTIFAIEDDKIHREIRDTCGEALRKIKGPPINSLLKYLVSQAHALPPDNRVLSRRLDLLGEIGNERVIDTLKSVLNDPFAGWRNRAAAARSLGRIGGERALQVLKDSQPILDKWVNDEINEVLEKAAEKRQK